MPKLFQISIEVNANSVGKIAEQIGEAAMADGWESYIAYARDSSPSKSRIIKIGSKLDVYWHGLMTRLFDRHCLHSTKATKKLIKQIKEINPDVIQLQHIHGYFLDMRVLFDYLQCANKPVVWTFHDCWAFTGHCAYFYDIENDSECEKWKTECFSCLKKNEYPGSILIDRSRENYVVKKRLFTSVKNMTIVPVSDWLANLTKQSFLKLMPIQRIYNGIDIDTFSPKDNKREICKKYGILTEGHFVLGAASTWCDRKGLSDFYYVRECLPQEIGIVMVGLTEAQISELPENIVGIRRTYNMQEMAELYAAASVFINPTYNDTLPTVNLESQACGTPVITYRTGGSPETIEEGQTGVTVERGNKDVLVKTILDVLNNWNLESTGKLCRERAVKLYDKHKNFKEYIVLYKEMLKSRV